MPTPRNSIEGGGRGGRLTYVQSPIDPSQWLCWCGQLQPSQDAAAECRHTAPRLPVIPGSIAFCPRTGFVDRPPAAERVEVHPAVQRYSAGERRRAGVGALIIMVAWVLLMLIMMLMPARSDDPGPIIVPTTYGWPGPAGGFTSMPVAPR